MSETLSRLQKSGALGTRLEEAMKGERVDYLLAARAVMTRTQPSWTHVLAQLQAGETVHQAGELPKTHY